MTATPDQIRELLHSENLSDRLRAVNDIRALPPDQGFALIQLAIGDANTRVRYAAVSQFDSLGGQDPDRSLELLRGLLSDPEPDVQAAAADCLGGLKLTAAYEDLVALYQSSGEWLVRFSILSALGELGDLRAVDVLLSALASDNELERLAAIGALGELADDRALPHLLPFMDSSDWQVRHRLALTLGQFDAPQARAALETLSQDAIAQVSEAAAAQLG
ncbi:MAG: HEAT repeat domain-containing protein [Limnothrix sp.]|uniref:HEAT repeat domain-containing protein n=1 Tax=unclassified Limnothrix TaxID=2632864 RepID=UPI00081DA10F|nr:MULTISPECIES: HEAT repeat domain-containing protein [unclassified Limnothrix]MEB3119137.1 HEAT repeat domain-containing protein [Limnothrix sp.]OCQ89207.1 phycocyanin alpha phycocyanobilin lyase [Limnothrix sp. P13C2]MBD2552122.1 HEAT repeat domain-containing protein [Limnothrix sp. FACHB-708]MBD2592358.1 HEAT repeat domain-containing protein [Limnothrix sp. FACHB-406]MBD2633766.1 HEAT repeat domain-containing protein [Limnothrix sp. FACHB-881]